MDSLVVETAFGLIFVFATFSLLVSMLTEAAARNIGLRGEYLLRGIRSLVDSGSTFELPWRDVFRRKPVDSPDNAGNPMVTKVVSQPVIARSAVKASMPNEAGNRRLTAAERRRLPSYVSGRSFARAFIDTLVADMAGDTTIDKLKRAVDDLEVGDGLKRPLQTLLDEAKEDISVFRRSVEGWYDDHMARVSGWYKRHVRWISLGFAAVIVLLFNVNAVEISRSLYSDEALRASVVAQATEAADCGKTKPAECLDDVRKEIRELRGAGLPIGWGTSPECAIEGANCNVLERVGLLDKDGDFWADLWLLVLVLLGWSLMVVATVPGARFWFDALSRLGSLRSSGPKPSANTDG